MRSASSARRRHRFRRPVALAVAGALLLAACSSDGDPEGAGPTATPPDDTATITVTPPVDGPLALRPLSTSDGRIVDDLGRDVLLRGVNVTSLGEYWQGDADHPPTQPMTDADWAAMAANGFSVVRLVVSWSRLEPEREAFDEAYVAEIDEYVTAAAAHGMHTVIDMHQDAYTATIATTDAAECPEGTSPAKGWDGAPGWATITDGGSTCITGDRNSSEAVTAAWNHFYDDTDGIRTRFAATWGRLAEHFAGRPEVAGYDLLNEPEVSRPAAELTPLYDALIADVVTEIRDAEADAPFGHLLFIEPAIPAGNPAFGIVVPDPERIGLPITNVVAAPHNYAESIDIGEVTIEAMNDLFLGVAGGIGIPTWLGEHGWWGTDAESLEELDRFAADLDANVLGGAWWQWRQPCGDPHSVPWGGYEATGESNEQIHLHGLACPGDEDLGPTEELLRIVRRAYPRAAPGTITTLESDWRTGALTVEGTGAAAGDELVAWTPTGTDGPTAVLEGLEDLVEHEVDGGRVLTATVVADGAWSLRLVPR